MAQKRGYVQLTVLAERKGSITVSALVGTGLVTLGIALTGVAGLGDDLQAASRQAAPTTPLLTPQDETATPSATTPSASTGHRLDVDCLDHKTSRSQATGGDGSARET